MILHYLSASRIKSYIQCPENYYQSYEMKVKGEAIHLTFGTLIHSVFERWFQEEIDIAEIYQEEWDNANIVDPDFYRDGFDILENFMKINDRDGLSLGFEHAFAIDIHSGKIYSTDHVDFSNRDEAKAFLDGLQNEDAPIIFGFIDRIAYDMDNDMLKIVDYKTSRIALTQQEADDDVQLSMYALVASYIYPEYPRVVSELQYVRLGAPVRTYRTAEQLESFREWLISVYYKIKNDTTHAATINKYCGWCASKGVCVAYQELINSDPEDINLDGMSDDEMDTQLEKLAIHIKILEGRKKEIETTFKDKLKRSDNAPIYTNNGERFLTPNMRTYYDVGSIIEIFPNDYHNLLSVSKGEVDKIVGKNSELKQALESRATKEIQSYTLRKRKS
jgi:hypothetical protein